MLAPAVFGIDNDGLNTAVNVLLLVLVVIWVALIFWTFADARRRLDDPLLVGCATLASVFPFVGTIVYLIIRPPEFVDDVRLRELEMQAAEARLIAFDYQLCPHCDNEISRDMVRCPNCLRKLKERCFSCGKPLDPEWKICPFCEADVATQAPQQQQQRRRRRANAGSPNAATGVTAAAAGPEKPRASSAASSEKPRAAATDKPRTTTDAPPRRTQR